MTLVVTINDFTDTGFSGEPVSTRQSVCTLDGQPIPEMFSYDGAATDAQIVADVRAKLTSRGYLLD